MKNKTEQQFWEDLKPFIQNDSFCNNCYNLWRIGADLQDVKDTMILHLLKIKGKLECELVKAKEREMPQQYWRKP